jgi:predicted unusual protein kinase regulating ubiquinone biosynthesis (AarF/ABC1/UbiB family)
LTGWTWLAAVLATIALIVVGLRLWVWRASRRRNEAGIPTDGRGWLMGGFVVRRVWRRGWLRLRMLVVARRHHAEMAHAAHVESAEEAAKLMGNMKGVFMKLGQIVSFADDALPAQAKASLQTLQKDAPPMAFKLVRQVIERELGGDLHARFKHVDEEPLAAASIGQVHRAQLRDGTDVVLKVQYPGVDAAIEGDLGAIGRMAGMIGAMRPSLDVPAVLAELRARIVDELDYRKEARSQALFAQLWDGHPMIRVPRVYAEHTTKRVLTSAFVRGFGFYDFVREADDREKRVAAAAIGDFVFDSMFCHLAYNGDPHPGNYLFHDDGAVTFLDFGCVKRFSPAQMSELMQFFRAICEGDRATHDAYIPKLGLVLPGRTWDHDKMWAQWRYHLEPYWSAGFVFSPEYLARAKIYMDPEFTKDFNLPPDMLFFTRITFGLNAISQQLGARGDFAAASRRYFYLDRAAPSGLGLEGIVVPRRFTELPWTRGAGEVVAEIEAAGELPALT